MTEQHLLEAVQFGNLQKVRAGLEQKLDPNYADDEGNYTLVHWASQEGFVDIIKLLVQFGADVDAYFLGYITALYSAAGDGNLEVVKALVGCGADVNNTQKIGTALHNAVTWSNKDIAEFLLASGANVNAADDEGTSPLRQAISRNYIDMAELLVSYGAQKHVTEAVGLSETVRVCNAALNRLDELGLKQLGKVEQVLVCVLTLKFEVEERGFEHFYSNPSGDLANEMLPALKRIGATHTRKLMKQANALFDDGKLPKEREARVEIMACSKKLRTKLDKLSDNFLDDKDDLRELLDKFVAENRPLLPSR